MNKTAKVDVDVTHNDSYLYHAANPVDLENVLEEGGTFTLPEEVRYCVRDAVTSEATRSVYPKDEELEFQVDTN